jgi:hypothetical protein
MSPIAQLDPSVSEQLKELTRTMKRLQQTMERMVTDRAPSSGPASSVTSIGVQATTVAGLPQLPADLEPEVPRRRRTKSPSWEAQRAEQVRQQPFAAAQALVASLEERVPPDQRSSEDIIDRMLRSGDFDRITIEQSRTLLVGGLLPALFQHVRTIVREEMQPGFLGQAAQRVETVAAREEPAEVPGVERVSLSPDPEEPAATAAEPLAEEGVAAAGDAETTATTVAQAADDAAAPAAEAADAPQATVARPTGEGRNVAGGGDSARSRTPPSGSGGYGRKS